MGLGEPVPTLVPWLKLVLTGSLVLGATPPPYPVLKIFEGLVLVWFRFEFFFPNWDLVLVLQAVPVLEPTVKLSQFPVLEPWSVPSSRT